MSTLENFHRRDQLRCIVTVEDTNLFSASNDMFHCQNSGVGSSSCIGVNIHESSRYVFHYQRALLVINPTTSSSSRITIKSAARWSPNFSASTWVDPHCPGRWLEHFCFLTNVAKGILGNVGKHVLNGLGLFLQCFLSKRSLAMNATTATFGLWFNRRLNLLVGIRLLNRLSQNRLGLWILDGIITNDFDFPIGFWRLLGFI